MGVPKTNRFIDRDAYGVTNGSISSNSVSEGEMPVSNDHWVAEESRCAQYRAVLGRRKTICLRR